MRIWTPSVPPIIRDNQAGTTIECKDYILEVPGGSELPSRILSLITELGRARTREYFIKYYINNYGEVKKSDKIVDLFRINLMMDGIKEKLSQQLILHTSIMAKDFDKIMFIKAKLREQCSDMYLEEKRKSENHQVDINDPLPKIGTNKTYVLWAFLSSRGDRCSRKTRRWSMSWPKGLRRTFQAKACPQMKIALNC
jgi:hypothetical protein